MTHRFTKSATDYASGQLELMLQRIEIHRRQHAGRMPTLFVLHPASSEALNGEHYKRFGQPHRLQFAGVPIVICRCGVLAGEYPDDKMITADGRMEIL